MNILCTQQYTTFYGENACQVKTYDREVSLSMVASFFFYVQGSSSCGTRLNRTAFLGPGSLLCLSFHLVQVIFVDGLMGDNWPTNASICDASAPEGYGEQLPLALHCFVTIPSYQFNRFQHLLLLWCPATDFLMCRWPVQGLHFFAVCQTPMHSNAFKRRACISTSIIL